MYLKVPFPGTAANSGGASMVVHPGSVCGLGHSRIKILGIDPKDLYSKNVM